MLNPTRLFFRGGGATTMTSPTTAFPEQCPATETDATRWHLYHTNPNHSFLFLLIWLLSIDIWMFYSISGGWGKLACQSSAWAGFLTVKWHASDVVYTRLHVTRELEQWSEVKSIQVFVVCAAPGSTSSTWAHLYLVKRYQSAQYESPWPDFNTFMQS